ncbi:FMN reductase [Rhodococcus tukisamuensis]|uniref:FMN reductase n=1 Tax=Rhodococcus tukisamuensis TaxID=168276 RepID=A0A1G6MW75_9NOCA|nr:FMN reductase [Rhodococcus tukisamuensis]SDC59789.1 FMN reductase [Rhodococcus tukisamuensis]
MTRRLAVVAAGLGQPSSTRLLADQLAAATTRALAELGEGAEVEVVELRDHAHDLMNNMLTGFPSGDLKRAIDAVVGADGLIVVTPIFNASYSGLFKSFFDVLEPGALDRKPVLIGATAGTARHSLAIEHAVRPMFAYLRAVAVPTGVLAASEDWGSGGTGSGLAGRIDRAAGELADAIAGRANHAPADPFDDPVPFEQLLAQQVR